MLKRITESEGSLEAFSRGYEEFGVLKMPNNKVRVKEWLPGAKAVYIFGDFNEWNRYEYPLSKDQYGVWKVELDEGLLKHRQFVKLGVVTTEGSYEERIPAYIRRVERRPPNVHFDGVYWETAEYVWRYPKVQHTKSLRIYECHVGMCSEEGKVCSFNEFRREVLPQVHAMGYNTLQLMAVMEHPYYGSFGYQVRPRSPSLC